MKTKKPSFANLQTGDHVTVIRRETAYYSQYGGRPRITFDPGMIGTVAAVKVPVVRPNRTKHLPPSQQYFHCVDFLSPTTGQIERFALYADNWQIAPTE